MQNVSRPRIGWMLLILLLLPMCVTRPVGGFAKPADLAVPECFWEEWIALTDGECGPFPCVEAFVAGAFQTDAENDAMIERGTMEIER